MKVGYYTESTGELYAVLEFPDFATPPDPQGGSGGIVLAADQAMPGYVAAGIFHAIPPKPSDSHIWSWTTKAWASDLDAAKAAKWSEIKTARDAQANNVFVWSGHVIQCNASSRAAILSYAQRAAREDEHWRVDWRLANNTYVALSASDLADVHRAMNAHIESTHAVAKQRWDSIQAATSVAALDAITWA